MRKILVMLLLGTALVGCGNEKTAYVDTTRLIQEFSEMKKVEADFTQRSEKLKKQLDSAARAFQQEVKDYQENRPTMSEAEQKAVEQELLQKQQVLQQQQQMQSGRLRQESDVVIDSLVTKVKDFVKEYGERNDYTYIFGSNESANILYAKEGLDITEEVLAELNENENDEQE